MQRILVSGHLIVMVIMLLACSTKDTSIAETFTCPMHPTVISDKPGSCPVCGMDLVRKARKGEEVTMTKELNKLTKSTNEVVTASIKTIRGEYKSISVRKELLGIVSYDTRNIYTIPSRVGGRLEMVFVKYNFQQVTKGMKIAEVYSPELISAQRELLFLIQSDASNKTVIDGAMNRLKFLGVSEKQIADLLKSQKVAYTFSIYSPYSGYVTMMNNGLPTVQGGASSASKSASGMSRMNAAKVTDNQTNISSSSESLPREGNYVTMGQTLFTIVDSNSIWIEFELPATDAKTINKGDEIVLENDSKIVRVDFIEPFTDKSKDFIRIRAYIKKDKLKIGQLVKGSINPSSKSSLWLPKSAVLDLGMNWVVFTKVQDQFKATKVDIGVQTNDLVEITSGLTSGDEVAIDAHYLMDSEGFVKVIK